MTIKIITIAQQKGGAGKTTLAAQLAVAFSAAGRRVVLVDIDPQGSLAAWDRARGGAGNAARFELNVVAVSGWRIGTELQRAGQGYDLAIVDSPPHAETEAKLAMRSAHLVIVPVQPSPMDVWATRPTVAVAQNAGVAALIVLNRVPPRGRLVDDMRSELRKLDTPVATAVLGNRVAFASSMLSGLGVLEISNAGPASREIKALAEEVTLQL